MVSKMIKNCNYIVQTALFFALAIGTQGKADSVIPPYMFEKSIAECAEDGTYSERDRLVTYLGDKIDPLFELEISCFKYWLDEERDQNIIVVSSLVDMDKKNEINLRQYAFDFFTSVYRDSGFNGETLDGQRAKIKFSPVEISNAGNIFPNTDDLHERDSITISEFTSLIKSDKGLGRLVQLNLQRPINQTNVSVCPNRNPKWGPFHLGAIDGLWGNESGRALQKFVESCQNTDDEITASMITEVLLPQLFSLSAGESTIDRGPTTSEGIEQNQTSSEDIANQDTESETSVTSTLEPIVAAEKDVEGTPVEDPDAVLENEKEISSLRDKLEEKDVEISMLRETISDLRLSKDEALSGLKREISKKTIFQIWEDLEIKVNGMMPNGNRIYADTQRQDSYGCRLSASEDVMKSAVEAYENDSCYRHTFGDMEIDTSKPFSWDEGNTEVTVYLLPKREKFIKSMETAGIIDGLTENNINNCGIELSLLKGKEQIELNTTTTLYADRASDGRQGVYLHDSGQLVGEKISYEGLSILINTSKIEDQKCSLPSGIEIPISTRDYIPKGLPQALIDRDGHVTIYDLPISAVKGATLAVFFDTNVGFEDATNYAFNAALTNKNMMETHKRYFSGFSQALKSYLKNQSKFENVIIYQSLSHEDALDSTSRSNFRTIFEGEGIDTKTSQDEFINALDEFVGEFNPGQLGTFSDKRKEIKLLLGSSAPFEFLSFGPSGLDNSEVCNVEKRLRFSNAVTVFDVWPRDTLDELVYSEQLDAQGPELVYKCTNSEQIFGLRVSPTSDQDDISSTVLEYLNVYLGRQ